MGNLQTLQGLRREGIGTFKARTAAGWQPTEVTGVEEGRDWHFQSKEVCRLATYRGYRGVTGVEEGRDWHFQS